MRPAGAHPVREPPHLVRLCDARTERRRKRKGAGGPTGSAKFCALSLDRGAAVATGLGRLDRRPLGSKGGASGWSRSKTGCASPACRQVADGRRSGRCRADQAADTGHRGCGGHRTGPPRVSRARVSNLYLPPRQTLPRCSDPFHRRHSNPSAGRAPPILTIPREFLLAKKNKLIVIYNSQSYRMDVNTSRKHIVQPWIV
jgi:hypothetical protein